MLQRENHTLKRSLTDPHLFSGIGNAYSDEILHRAKLSPFVLTSRIARPDAERLYDAIRQTLVEWTDRLRRETGDKFPEKVTAFRPEMAVHGRYNQPCPVCGTPVQRIVYAENESNYCPTARLRAAARRSALPQLLKEIGRVRWKAGSEKRSAARLRLIEAILVDPAVHPRSGEHGVCPRMSSRGGTARRFRQAPRCGVVIAGVQSTWCPALASRLLSQFDLPAAACTWRIFSCGRMRADSNGMSPSTSRRSPSTRAAALQWSVLDLPNGHRFYRSLGERGRGSSIA